MRRTGALAFVLTLVLAGVAPAWIAPPGKTLGQGDSLHAVVDAQGNALFVWTGVSPGGHDPNQIQARRLTAGGVLGPLLRLTDPTNSASDFSRDPQVALDSTGTAHVVWSHDGHGVETRTIAPSGTLGTLTPLASAGSKPQLAIDGGNKVHFVWINGHAVQTRTLGSSLSAEQDVSTSTTDSISDPQVAVDSGGNATFAWGANFTPGQIKARRLSADLSTLAPVANPAVASGTDDGFLSGVAVDSTGSAHLTWLGCPDCSTDNQVVSTRTIDSSGSLGTKHDVSDSSSNAFVPTVVADRFGKVEIGFLQRDGSDNVAELSSVGSGLPSSPVMLSHSGESAGGISIAAEGGNATDAVWREGSNVFARRVVGGVAQPTITTLSTDGTALEEPVVGAGPAGHVAAGWIELGFMVHVSIDPTPPPAKPPGGGGGTTKPPPTGRGTGTKKPPKDTAAPKLSKLKVSPHSFRAAGKGAAIAAKKKKKKKPKPGAKLSFTLSEKASVTVKLVAKKTGRKVRGVCHARTHANRKKPKCDRTLSGAVKLTGAAGENTFKLSGRWHGHKLSPGSYALVAVAKDAAGNKGKSHRAGFAVKKP